MGDGPAEDYLRSPIPEAELVDADGSVVQIAHFARDRAALLVFPGPAGDQRDTTLRTLADWPQRLPLVDFVLAVQDADALRDQQDPHADRVLGDPQAESHALFGSTDCPAAVLLGTDGLLAGGPALGTKAIHDLIEAMSNQFRHAYGEAMRPPTAISCKCITYGRVDFLEESLESFLRQAYAGEQELVIVNDYARQRLHFDHPRVRIYNLDFTFDTIGEKENFAVSACRYDAVAVWDDDDIALPNHLDNIDRFFPGHDLLHWERGAAFVEGSIEALGCLGNSGIVYSRRLWRDAGGHPLENAGYDVSLVNRLRDHGARVICAAPPPSEVSWFYSWGNGSYHMSGLGADRDGRANVIRRHAAHIEELRRQGHIPTGDIELKPHWKQDYSALLSDYCLRHSD